MRSRYPTDDELRRNFEAELTSVTTGGGLRSETGLDMETDAALIAIARAYPAVTDDLVAAARAAFAGQLDGSNADARQADLERLIAEHNARKRNQ
ncbi:hypothetical protein [Nocardia iowensis]|uniref:DUF222 domain-containing protein n=1 Tax=Nocardia iowensis TaxID=204891 RepID=A0ABX8RTB9_NOCIO|nr:hypothetical protein [Nocardia iowensis]QXN92496.1 hypothetical protein KV110_04920 [Nocardia iowensis]